MIVSDLQALRNVLSKSPELLPDSLAQRLQSFESTLTLSCVNTDALGGAVIHRYKYCGLALSDCYCRRHIRTLDLVRSCRYNGPIIRLRAMAMSYSL